MTYSIQLVVHCAAFLLNVDMANARTAGCITEEMDARFCQHEPLMSDHLLIGSRHQENLLLLGCTCKA